MISLELIRFAVPGRIQGKGRPRATTRGGSVVMYTPSSTAYYEAAIREAAYEAAHGARFPEGAPLRVEIEAIFAQPAARRKKGERMGYVTKRPDADNIAKAVLDALQGGQGIFEDDSCVAELHVSKAWAHPDQVADTLIVRVSILHDEDLTDGEEVND